MYLMKVKYAANKLATNKAKNKYLEYPIIKLKNPKVGLYINFQNNPTTTGEIIIGMRINVVNKPLPLNLWLTSIANPKPTSVCKPTDSRAKRPVVAKYFHNSSSFKIFEKFSNPTHCGCCLAMAE